MKLLNKSALSLLELGIAIAISAVIAVSTIASISILDSARASSVFNDVKKYQNAIISFSTEFNCLPGECPDSIVLKEFSDHKIASNCLSSIYEDLRRSQSDGMIKTRPESTCLFWSLQASGMIDEVLDVSNSAVSVQQKMTYMISGVTMPRSSKIPELSYEVISLGSDLNGVNFLPLEIDMGSLADLKFKDRIGILAVKSSEVATKDEKNDPWPFFANNAQRSIAYIPSSLAKKIDEKFDTGIPYIGKIIGGRDNPDAIVGTSTGSSGCTVLSSSTFNNESVNKNAVYNKAKGSKCILLFISPNA